MRKLYSSTRARVIPYSATSAFGSVAFHTCPALFARGFSLVDIPRYAPERYYVQLALIPGLKSEEVSSNNSLQINVKLKASCREGHFLPGVQSLDTHLLIYFWVLVRVVMKFGRYSGDLTEKDGAAYANN